MATVKVFTHLSDQEEAIFLLNAQNSGLLVNQWKKIESFERKPFPVAPGHLFAKYGMKFAVTLEVAKKIKANRGLYFLLKKIPVTIYWKGESDLEDKEEVEPKDGENSAS